MKNTETQNRIPKFIDHFNKSMDEVFKPKHGIEQSISDKRGQRIMLSRMWDLTTTSRWYEVVTYFVEYTGKSVPGTVAYDVTKVARYVQYMMRYLSCLITDWLLDRAVYRRIDGSVERWNLGVAYDDVSAIKPKKVSTRKMYGSKVQGVAFPKILLDLAFYSAWPRADGEDILFPLVTNAATSLDTLMTQMLSDFNDYQEWVSQTKGLQLVPLDLNFWLDKELIVRSDSEFMQVMGVGPFQYIVAGPTVVVKGLLDLFPYIKDRLDLVLLRALISQSPPATADGGATIDTSRLFIASVIGAADTATGVYSCKSTTPDGFASEVLTSNAEFKTIQRRFYKALGCNTALEDNGLYMYNHIPFGGLFDTYSFKEDVISVLLMQEIPGHDWQTFLKSNDRSDRPDKFKGKKPAFFKKLNEDAGEKLSVDKSNNRTNVGPPDTDNRATKVRKDTKKEFISKKNLGKNKT